MGSKRALVTGSQGFVGKMMTSQLREKGYHVTGLDVKNDTYLGDCRHMFRSDRGRYGMRYDLVVHCAAIVGGRKTIEDNPLAITEDLEIDSLMFQWARATRRAGHIVYFSSSAAYPVHHQIENPKALHEDLIDHTHMKGSPDMLYGWAKLVGEYLAHLAYDDGQPMTVVRPFSGYGRNQDDTYPFPAYIKRAIQRQDPFEVWGTGDQVRDFIHIYDVCRMTLELVDREIFGPVNLGTGVPTSFNLLAKRCMEAAGYEAPIKTDVSQPMGVDYRLADTKRMESYGIKPEISLEEGIEFAMRGVM